MERSAELESLIARWFEGASTGDASMVAKHVSPSASARLIGSDPDEIFRGGKAVADFLRGEVEHAAGNASFVPSDTEAFSEGSVGWASTSVKITMPDGKFVTPRWTSVFHKEDGIWKFVQTHASVGVPNDQIGWVYPA